MAHALIRPAVVVLAMVALLESGVSEAQWVLLARRVIGRVETISQTTPDGKSTFDTATVIVDVPADKVYATVKNSLEKARATEGITVTRADDAQRSVAFSRGDHSVAIQLAVLGDNLTQILLSSTRPAVAAPSGTMGEKEVPPTVVIVDRILAVCKQMNVECYHPEP